MNFFRTQHWNGPEVGVINAAALEKLREDSQRAAAFKVVARAWAAGLRPPPNLLVSDWAQAHRFVAPPSPATGEWRNERTPYLKGIMDTMSPHHPAREIFMMKGTQTGGTEVLVNTVGYYSHHVPGTTGMIVLPTKPIAREWSTLRLRSLFSHTAVLRELVQQENNRRRAVSDTTFEKHLANGTTWKITWASSAVLMRSTPAEILIVDEMDAIKKVLVGEGNFLDVLRNRFANYRRGKLVGASSPTNRHTSQVEVGFLAGDQRYFFLPCPHCNWLQRLYWDQFYWPDGRPEATAYRCAGCEQLIAEHYKTQMFNDGMWVATARAPHLAKVGFPSG